MSKKGSAIIISSLLLSFLATACSAEDGAASKSTASASASASAGGGAKNIAQRMASFTTGVIVGTPIAIFRKSVECTASDTKELVGESRNPIFLVPAGMLSLPWGVFSGSVEGLYAGIADSWVNADDKPFSKDSFSLGEMK